MKTETTSNVYTERSNTMKLKFFILIFLLSVALYIYCDPLPEREKLVYDIKYGVITAGEATLDLQRTTYQDKDVWQIQVTAKTNSFFDKMFKVRDFIESIAQYENFYSLRFTKKMEEGSYRQHRVHLNYLNLNKSVYSSYQHKTGTFRNVDIEIPSNTLDIMSAFYYARTQNLQPKDYLKVNITIDGKNYDAGVEVIKRENIESILGKKTCLQIRPVLQGEAIFKQTGSIDIWLTDDGRKIPVLLSSKVIFGSFKAILKSVS